MNPFENTSGHRYLIIARVGDKSMHQEWLKPASFKNFDICLSYYGDTPGLYAEECDFYLAGKGTKWPSLYAIIEAYGERIFQYDAIWFPDDDIQTNAININRMFQLFSEQKLLLAQPALNKNARYQVTAQNIDYELRYTPFVEAMVPLFSREALLTCWPTFNKNRSGWGLEFVWAKLLNYPNKKIAILDATPVKHTKPSSKGDLYSNINASLQIDADLANELQMLAEYGVTPPAQEITFNDGIKKWKPSPYHFSNQSLNRRKRKKFKIATRKKSSRKVQTKKLKVRKFVAKKTKKLATLYKMAARRVKKKVIYRKPAIKKSA